MSVGQLIEQTFYATIIVFSLIGFLCYLNSCGDHDRTRWQRFSSWFLNRYFPYLTVMSNEEDEDEEETAETEAKLNSETAENPSSIAENRGETFSLAETRRIQVETLARLVINDYVNLSDAVKVGMASPTGDAYSKSTRILKAEIERQKQRYRPLPEEQEQKRRQLELARK